MDGSQALGESDERQTNSMCAMYAELIEKELRSADTDYDLVYDLLGQIRKNCQAVSHQPGEMPDHLEEHVFE